VAALRLTNKTGNHNFASIPAGPGFAKPLNSAASTSEDAVTTYRIQHKDRTFMDEAVFKGMSYRSGDYIHIMNPNDASKPIIGQVFKAYTPDG
jgi:chromatin structure-remodeling complex subunit RSC1/2